MSQNDYTRIDRKTLEKYLNCLVIIQENANDGRMYSHGIVVKVLTRDCVLDPSCHVDMKVLSEVRLVDELEKEWKDLKKRKERRNKYHFLAYKDLAEVHFFASAPDPFFACLFVNRCYGDLFDSSLILIQEEKISGNVPVFYFKSNSNHIF